MSDDDRDIDIESDVGFFSFWHNFVNHQWPVYWVIYLFIKLQAENDSDSRSHTRNSIGGSGYYSQVIVILDIFDIVLGGCHIPRVKWSAKLYALNELPTRYLCCVFPISVTSNILVLWLIGFLHVPNVCLIECIFYILGREKSASQCFGKKKEGSYKGQFYITSGFRTCFAGRKSGM